MKIFSGGYLSLKNVKSKLVPVLKLYKMAVWLKKKSNS